MLSRTLILKASGLGFVERLVRRSPLFKPMVGRFIAGDDLAKALEASTPLLDRKLKVSLDYLGENTKTEAEAVEAKNTYIQMLETIQPFLKERGPVVNALKPGLPPPAEDLNISIKLTQCGLDQGAEFCEANLREVLWCAEERNNFVRLDMEGSPYTERTLQMLEKVFLDFPNTGTVLQSYLHRTDEDVERIIKLGARCRLVKGAYLEPAEVAYSDKGKVDEAYVRQAKRMLDAAFYPALATQDARIIATIKSYVEEKKIDKAGFEFQFLYGIRRDLQESLVAEGYNVRVYLPFGDKWYPYFTRRLAERPANVAFILKAMIRR
jgi:proline dehydrogenase